jgi:hypothetical protein
MIPCEKPFSYEKGFYNVRQSCKIQTRFATLFHGPAGIEFQFLIVKMQNQKALMYQRFSKMATSSLRH